MREHIESDKSGNNGIIKQTIFFSLSTFYVIFILDPQYLATLGLTNVP